MLIKSQEHKKQHPPRFLFLTLIASKICSFPTAVSSGWQAMYPLDAILIISRWFEEASPSGIFDHSLCFFDYCRLTRCLSRGGT
jgi:hypothetical protein